MKKSIVPLLHIGFWICYLILIMVMLAMFFRGDEEIDARIEEAFNIMFFFAIVPSIISFYSFYLFLFPKYLQQKKFVLTFIYAILISLGAALVGYAFLTLFNGEDCGTGEEGNIFVPMVLFISFIALVTGIVAMVIKGFLTWLDEIKLKAELKERNQEMEMALIKSQLDPHFLFNTINNIDVLILKNAETASTYLNKLSDIMRFMLYETKTDQILLSKEIAYIEKYIELQKIRTANDRYVQFSLEGSLNGQTIAPMIFIPFIENAFKHTNNKKIEEAISISIVIEKEKVTFECINKFDTTRKRQTESNGLGNALIQKRLELIYPNRHNLEVINKEETYQVLLTVDL